MVCVPLFALHDDLHRFPQHCLNRTGHGIDGRIDRDAGHDNAVLQCRRRDLRPERGAVLNPPAQRRPVARQGGTALLLVQQTITANALVRTKISNQINHP
jgi:hypothetical protein